jgi:putative heme-binding domain-containing protein
MQGKAEKALRKLWQGDDQRMRARALQLLARQKGSEKRYLTEAIKDANPDIRITGLRIARQLKWDVIPMAAKLSHDASPAVRRECAIALRHNPAPEAASVWTELAAQHDGKDRWYLEALGIGADNQWDKFLEIWTQKMGGRHDTAASRDIIWRSRSNRHTPELLAKIINSRALNEPERRRYFRSFDFLSGPGKQQALIGFLKRAELDSGTIAIEVLGRLQGVDAELNPEIAAGVRKALQQMRGTAQFVEVVRNFKIKDQDEALLDFAVKDPASSAAAEAMRLILKHGQTKLLEATLAGTNAPGAALALGNTAQKEIVPLLEPIVIDRSRALPLRKQTVQALAKAQPGAAWLLKLAQEQNLPDDLKFTVATELNNARWSRLKAEAARALPLPNSSEARPLPPISELAKLKGNATAGALIYRRDTVGCIKCHQVNGEGTDFGPNLSDIGNKLGKDALYEAILDPSAGISFGYESWQIVLKNGDDANGFIASETADELALKTVGGIVSRYKKSDIASKTQQKTSIMPSNLQQMMTVQELVDLVEYLTTLKTQTAVNKR